MKVVCAWCNSVIQNDLTLSGKVSHGMCHECEYTFINNSGAGLRRVMNELACPVLVMDSDAVVLDANTAAAAATGREVPAMVRLRGGVVIECENSKTKEGCGRSVLCGACNLRNTITATYRDSQARYGIVSEHPISCDDGEAILRLEFSTAKLGDSVILTLESRGVSKRPVKNDTPDSGPRTGCGARRSDPASN